MLDNLATVFALSSFLVGKRIKLYLVMGSLRKESTDRFQIPHRDQTTLLPCPACKANGVISIETETTYKQISCRWCCGLGHTTKRLFNAYHRIERIYKLWKSKGLI